MFIDIHSIFLFLGTIQGDLLKRFIELILVAFATYMVTSEYTKNKRTELKYLIFAFGILAIEKFLFTITLASIVFGNVPMRFYLLHLPIINHTIEIFALILLSYGFLFPIIKKKIINYEIFTYFFIVATLFIFVESDWLFTLFSSPVVSFNSHWSNILFVLIKIFIILFSILFLSIKTERRYIYRYSTVIAFLVYLVDPFLLMINIFFYGNSNSRLFVAAHPFPFIAIALFTRVIYLKLVDKAFLRDELKLSKQKYLHEKEINKMKDEFVSKVSHEFRTPLTSINLYTELMQKGKFGRLTNKLGGAVKIVKDESKRLSLLINDLLDIAKLESGKMKLYKEKFNLFNYINDNPYFSLAKEKKVDVLNKISKDFFLYADKEKFKQVIINLFSNALKHTKSGGSIIFSAFEDSKKSELIIQDTGSGMEKEELEKIFDKFYQVDHYMTRSAGGTGLGLTIVNEIIKRHGGEIKVESEPNKGSKFTIILPKNL